MRDSANVNDFSLVAMLGLLGLRIFEATGLDIGDVGDIGEEHGHRVRRVLGNRGKTVLVPLPPAVGRAIDRAADARTEGPVPPRPAPQLRARRVHGLRHLTREAVFRAA